MRWGEGVGDVVAAYLFFSGVFSMCLVLEKSFGYMQPAKWIDKPTHK